MGKIEIIYEAKCKHCKFLGRYYKGRLTRHKCMFGYVGDTKTFNDIANFGGKHINLRDKACKDFQI